MASGIETKTNVPAYHEMLWPTLQALKQLGGSGTVQEIMDRVVEIEGYTEAQHGVIHGKGPGTEIGYRLHWARSYLKKVDAIANSSRGVWAITDSGRRLSEAETNDIPARVRKTYSDKIQVGNKQTEPLLNVPVPFRETIKAEEDEAGERIGETAPEAWRYNLLDLLVNMLPEKFEILCQRILRESGVIDVKVTQRSRDGGIDGTGVLRLNLLSFTVAFQCKRYQGNVRIDAIRNFRGAMAGRTDKGILITTGTFTPDAKKEATRTGVPVIDLIDGDELCNLLNNLGLGVHIRQVEEISIDKQWFSDI